MIAARLAVALLGASLASGQFVPGEFAAHGARLHYRLFTPENLDSQKRYPLVLWLHDVLGVGSDNLRQIEGSNTAGSHAWVEPETQANHPAFVLAPQCPFGALWINFLSRTPSRRLNLVLELMEQLKRDLPIDPHRVYIVGQSMGGFGVWALLAAHPDQFAAAVPVSGGGRTSKARLFAQVPVWAFHGRIDPLVPVRESRRMIAALKKAGGEPRYTELPLRAHNNAFWEEVFSDPLLVEWLFAQHRATRSARFETPPAPLRARQPKAAPRG